MHNSHNTIQALYDSMWSSADDALAENRVEVDPFLNQRDTDRRNGLSLILRVPVIIQPALSPLLDDLRRAAPSQYVYSFSDLHVTLLTLIPVTIERLFPADLIARYHNSLQNCLRDLCAFDIHLRGITATPRAVMIQGFADSALNQMRDAMREALHAAGLGEWLDTRYKITAAHVTVLRFASPPDNMPELHRTLRDWRKWDTDFGTFSVREIAFLQHDYFLSAAKTQTLHLYPLRHE